MSIMSQMQRQCRKPTGWLGRMVARGMHFSHSDMTDRGLGQISIGNSDTILDIGCGGGGTISSAPSGLRTFMALRTLTGVGCAARAENQMLLTSRKDAGP